MNQRENERSRLTSLTAFEGGAAASRDDHVAVEAPLEIRIVHGPASRRMRHQLTVTLRTPGHDAELALGLLRAEGLIESVADVLEIREAAASDRLTVELHPSVQIDTDQIARAFASTASCGICGKVMLDIEAAASEPVEGSFSVPLSTLLALPDAFNARQTEFARTGGVHAAALCDARGDMREVREDVGRHNAVDKLLGAELARGRTRLPEAVLLLSGRAGYELIQKATRFGVPVVAAIGAPTSLAIDLAERMGISLIGFLRNGRCNGYSHVHRIRATD